MKFMRPILLTLFILSCTNAEEKSLHQLIPDSVLRVDKSIPRVPALNLESGCSEGEQYVGGERPEDIGYVGEIYTLRDLATDSLYTVESCHGLLLLRDGVKTLDTLGTLSYEWGWHTYGQKLQLSDSLIIVNEAIGKGNSQSGDVQFIGIVNGDLKCLARIGSNGANHIEFGYYQLEYEARSNPLRVYCREATTGTRVEDGASQNTKGWHRFYVLWLDTNEYVLYNSRLSLVNVPLFKTETLSEESITGTFPGLLCFYTPRMIYVQDRWCYLTTQQRDQDAEWPPTQRSFSRNDGWECHCE